jgi:hypothetical protein
MENKIILELISKNLEEIKFLFETMQKDEKPDPLLIELTTLKAKSLYQELRLLAPKDSLIENDDIILDADEQPFVDQIDDNVQNQEETGKEISNCDTTFIEENEIEEEIITEEISVDENLTEEENPIEAGETLNIENNEFEETTQELISSDEPENESGATVFDESGCEPVSSTSLERENEITELDNEVSQEELNTENIPSEEPVDLIEIVPESDIEKITSNGSLEEEAVNESTEKEKKVSGEENVKEPSLNEKLASAFVHEPKIKAQPISSIKGAIGLNDRFLFTRELFGNDSTRYESTIDYLDQSANILEAIEFLEKNFQWTKNDASLKFMDLVKRRFDN